jgi:hypothetical protein
MNRFGRKALQPLGVKLQPIDDLVDHLALGAHRKADANDPERARGGESRSESSARALLARADEVIQ